MNKIKSYTTKEKLSFSLVHNRYFGQLKKRKQNSVPFASGNYGQISYLSLRTKHKTVM